MQKGDHKVSKVQVKYKENTYLGTLTLTHQHLSLVDPKTNFQTLKLEYSLIATQQQSSSRPTSLRLVLKKKEDDVPAEFYVLMFQNVENQQSVQKLIAQKLLIEKKALSSNVDPQELRIRNKILSENEEVF